MRFRVAGGAQGFVLLAAPSALFSLFRILVFSAVTFSFWTYFFWVPQLSFSFRVCWLVTSRRLKKWARMDLGLEKCIPSVLNSQLRLLLLLSFPNDGKWKQRVA